MTKHPPETALAASLKALIVACSVATSDDRQTALPEIVKAFFTLLQGAGFDPAAIGSAMVVRGAAAHAELTDPQHTLAMLAAIEVALIEGVN